MSGAQDELRALIGSYWKPQMAVAAARLGLADAMGDAPQPASAIAEAIGADAEALARFLRALASIGLVEDHGEGQFSLTAMGQRLRADHPESLKGMALHVGTQLMPAFAQLHDCVRTGKPPADIRYGPDGFADLNEDAGAAAVFNQAMVDNSRRFVTEAAAAYDFTRFETIMDVGGGYGAVLAGLLKAAPQARGCVLDMAHAREGAEAYFTSEGVADRARFVTASFFDALPEAADCYVLKYILHDWAEEPARTIVQRVGEAARQSGGTVIIIEKLMPEQVAADPDHAVALYGDMTMMLWDGRERTRAQFVDLLAHGGLALTRTLALSDNHHLIEAMPA
jgi:hypothetical protein